MKRLGFTVTQCTERLLRVRQWPLVSTWSIVAADHHHPRSKVEVPLLHPDMFHTTSWICSRLVAMLVKDALIFPNSFSSSGGNPGGDVRTSS